jgi:hypothetical protein
MKDHGLPASDITPGVALNANCKLVPNTLHPERTPTT